MIKVLKDNEVPVLADKHDVYVHFTTKASKAKPDKVRVYCDLCRRRGETDEKPLVTVSFLCNKSKSEDYRKEVVKRAPGALRSKLQKMPEKQELFEELFGAESPFGLFYNMHFANIAQLHGWAASTIRQYEQTLKLLIPWIPHKFMADLTAEDFDAAIDAQCAAYFAEHNEPYSDSRIGQFVDVFYALMNYAEAELLLDKNPIKESKYYDSTITRTTLLPMDTLIEKRMRSKGLEVSEQTCVAEEITKEIMNGNPLAIGTGIQLLTGLRPSEVCALRGESIFPFTTAEWEHRNYFLVCSKIDSVTGVPSYAMKTRHAYRAMPIQRTLQFWLDLHRKKLGESVSDEEFRERFLVTTSKDGRTPIKSKVLGDYSAKLLRRSVKNPDFANLQIPVELDQEGNWVSLEKNKNAYQFRRNFGNILLNDLGMNLCPDAQGLFGHKLLNEDRRRWLLNHEDILIEKLRKLDQLVLLPASGVSAEEFVWRERDPREMVHHVDGAGSYDDVPALRLEVRPYSDTDTVTVRLRVKAKEPGDALRASVLSDREVDVNAEVFFAESKYRGTVNLQNEYLDEVFADAKSAVAEVLPGETGAEEPEEIVEDEFYDEDSVIRPLEEVEEIYDADEEFEDDEEGDDDEEI